MGLHPVVTSDFSEFVDYCNRIGNRRNYKHTESRYTCFLNYEHPTSQAIKAWDQYSLKQQEFIGCLKRKQAIDIACTDFAIISYELSDYDSKDVFVSNDLKLVYDAKPWWLRQYLDDISIIDRYLVEGAPEFSSGAVPGSLSSYSHFTGRNLLAIYYYSLYLKDAECYIPRKYKPWQGELTDLFTFTNAARLVNTDTKRSLHNNIFTSRAICRFSDCWLFEELDDWICLSALKEIYLQLQVEKASICDPTQNKERPEKIYLSRSKYELSAGKSPRVENFKEIEQCLRQENFSVLYPETMHQKEISNIVYGAKIIVCDPGSCFMNYTLFANRDAEIYQLLPTCLFMESDDWLTCSNIQWYLPRFSQIRFIKGIYRGDKSVDWKRKAYEAHYYCVEEILRSCGF
jgi:hypothetical protein